MLKSLATLFAAVVAVVVIVAPANAAGLQDARERRAKAAQAEIERGDNAFGEQKWDEAIEHYTAAIDAGSCGNDCGKYYYRRGVAWLQKEDCTHAVADFTKAEETVTDNGELYYNHYQCLAKANQDDQALAFLNKAITANPGSSIYHYTRCIILFNKHDFTGALPDCEVTLGPAPDDQTMLLATATSAEQVGDKTKAAKYYKHLLDLNKGNQQAIDGLSRVGG